MGAVGGHMLHLYDDLDLTFGDIKEILRSATEGTLALVEKVDGINMFFTVDAAGQVLFARRKSDIKSSDATLSVMQSRFSDHPAGKQIVEGCAAINSRLKFSCTPYFGASKKNWVNAELISRDRPVSIPYSHDAIVLHEMRSYDASGCAISSPSAQDRFNSLCAVFSGNGSQYTYYSPIPVFTSNRFGEGFYTEALQQISSFQGTCSDNDTLRDRLWIAVRRGLVEGLPISGWKKEALANKICGFECRSRLVDIKRGEPKKIANAISEYGKVANRHKVVGKALRPLKRTIDAFGASLLEGVHSSLVDNPHDKVLELRQRIKETRALAHAVYDGYQDQRNSLIEAAVEDLNSVGGIKSCIEGVVFEYGDNKYKFTGAYAAANQIIGIGRNGRGQIPPLTNSMLNEVETSTRYTALLSML